MREREREKETDQKISGKAGLSQLNSLSVKKVASFKPASGLVPLALDVACVGSRSAQGRRGAVRPSSSSSAPC